MRIDYSDSQWIPPMMTANDLLRSHPPDSQSSGCPRLVQICEPPCATDGIAIECTHKRLLLSLSLSLKGTLGWSPNPNFPEETHISSLKCKSRTFRLLLALDSLKTLLNRSHKSPFRVQFSACSDKALAYLGNGNK